MKWLKNAFELSRGGQTGNVRPMEGLRGFAVFLVFLVHYASLARPWLTDHPAPLFVADALHTMGNAGVDLFFVLSGYLIYESLISRPQVFNQFMKRRIQRIYPAFTVVFAFYFALSFIFPAESKIPKDGYDAAIYLLQNFLLLPGLVAIEPMITVAWSLSYEMFFYLAVPIFIEFFRLRQRGNAWRTVLFLTTAVGIAIYCAAFGGHVRLIMFISGMLLREVLHAERVPAPSNSYGLVALIVGLLFTLTPITGASGAALKSSILFVSFFVLCWTCFQYNSDWLARAFSWTPLRWLGNMSYSYYLLHGLVLKAGFLLLPLMLPIGQNSTWTFYVLMPLMFGFTLFPTAILYLAVERPFSLVRRTPKKGLEGSPTVRAGDDAERGNSV